ncbi:MAG TPA: AbrB/MazE/SpoVT family DNA-binding domain-containing protein [Synergistales bacterium]|jgi:AbrB family looped-hinge helix DNA binding protein|nr:AbrB/MazE/SpoVT family DNA-binding domain-containing protein [Synergistales bacterium]
MSAISLKVDEKGRVTLPNKLRKNLGIKPGDTLFLQEQVEYFVLKKAVNPFDALALDALREHNEGKAVGLKDVASELGVDLE